MFVQNLSQFPALNCILFLNSLPFITFVCQRWVPILIYRSVIFKMFSIPWTSLVKLPAFWVLCTENVWKSSISRLSEIGHVLYKWHLVNCARQHKFQHRHAQVQMEAAVLSESFCGTLLKTPITCLEKLAVFCLHPHSPQGYFVQLTFWNTSIVAQERFYITMAGCNNEVYCLYWLLLLLYRHLPLLECVLNLYCAIILHGYNFYIHPAKLNATRV